jgi:MFS family permease
VRIGLLGTGEAPAARQAGIRTYYLVTSVDAVGTGLFFSGSVLFLLRGVGLSSEQVGTGMGLAALVAFLTTVPLGVVANRVGAQRMLILLQLWRGAAYACYAFVPNFWWFIALACLVSMAERMDAPLTQAVLGSIAGDSGRSHVYVQVRRIRNAGFGVGALFAAAATVQGSVLGYRLLVLGNALSFLVAALFLSRIRASGSGQRPRGGRSLGARAIRDMRYLRLTAVNVLLTLYMTMLPTALPLWIIERTSAPRLVIQLLILLSIVAVIVGQKRFARGADDIRGSRRCLRWAAWSLSLAAATVGLTGRIHNVGWVIILLIGATLLVTAAELWQTVGGWNLSYAMAPEAQRPEYLAVFSLSSSAQRIIGPPLFTLVVIPLGSWGWLLLAMALSVLALLSESLLGPAPGEPGAKTMGTPAEESPAEKRPAEPGCPAEPGPPPSGPGHFSAQDIERAT